MPWSLQEAKNRFSHVVDAAASGAPQLVTRHGKPAVIVLAAEEYERLTRLDRAAGPALNELLLTLPQDDRPLDPADLDARDVSFRCISSTPWFFRSSASATVIQAVVAWIKAQRTSDLFLSVITVGEIERGIESQRPKDAAFALALASWLDRLLILYADHIVGIDLSTARRWGRLSAEIGHAGTDLMIGRRRSSTALPW